MKQNNLIGWHMIWWITMFGTAIIFLWFIYNFTNIIMYKKRRTSLYGKVVIITGASSGLGEALAHVFYSCGCKLILISRRNQELLRVKDTLLNTHHTVSTHIPVVFPLDLTEINTLTSEVAKVSKIYGRIDILINNAGISYRGEVIDTKVDVDIKVMLINYFSQIALAKAVLPYMIKQKFGHIVCTSSVQGKIAIPFRSAYTASKHALQAWCDSARAELSTKNIKITVISAGYIYTALSLNALTGTGDKYGIMDKTTKNGYSAKYVADKILESILRGDKEVTIATFTQKIAISLRVLLPSIYFWLIKPHAKTL
ncbi:PREDICTED: dehydrogenase/reductase SDR family protein 7-like isoform X1 [Ceratosolen solmsi marchali]|uniref:Dehydrogenase/reductase SDR family protein 7-like isoform X1 n=1 Tax=Ceratosolen solmsi marchali TaxID=326594 RepID=A0AAJ7DZU9_9HYME|nr:PREDICTED: dehydrogenase/reductase SDR family protein 7-like isoform X1 [Ceratosolen solmsi marchali]